MPSFFAGGKFQPYRHFGERQVWVDPANPHNPMMDQIGRVWMTSQIRNRQNPAYCGGAGNKFGEYFPMETSSRQASYYDPKTKQFTLIDTCFSTHHLQFAEDDNNTLYFSGDRLAFGWIDTKKYDATKDEQASQGWCPAVLDTNGDGKITKPWNEPATGRGAAAKPADVRSGARHARADRHVLVRRRRQSGRRLAMGSRPTITRASCSASSPATIRRRRASPSGTRCRRSSATGPAASTSTATA